MLITMIWAACTCVLVTQCWFLSSGHNAPQGSLEWCHTLILNGLSVNFIEIYSLDTLILWKIVCQCYSSCNCLFIGCHCIEILLLHFTINVWYPRSASISTFYPCIFIAILLLCLHTQIHFFTTHHLSSVNYDYITISNAYVHVWALICTCTCNVNCYTYKNNAMYTWCMFCFHSNLECFSTLLLFSSFYSWLYLLHSRS